jgi:3-dehydroquinate synthase
MKIVHVDLAKDSYRIEIGRGSLFRAAESILPLMPNNNIVIVTNTTVGDLYSVGLIKSFEEKAVRVSIITIPDGEEYKTLNTLRQILDALFEYGAERGTTLIALGGGVVGDMAGFAAAIYQRGIPFIQLPTTLLSQVDSSVGGKTAVNHPSGKNMVGAFYQPRLVIIDLDVLKTLPDREFAAGMAEVIKYGIIFDFKFFEWLEFHIDACMRRDVDALEHIVEASCRSKAQIVAQDETEQGLRAILNFGHTFGHAIESGLGFGVWLHGEAVGAGMILAARASHLRGRIAQDDLLRIERLIHAAGLPTEPPKFPYDQWLELMSHDKKVEKGKTRFVLLNNIGDAFLDGLDESTLRQLLG